MKSYEAITRSISHNEIVNVKEGCDGMLDELHEACDDSVKSGDVFEFWGAQDGQEWRVHVLLMTSESYEAE